MHTFCPERLPTVQRAVTWLKIFSNQNESYANGRAFLLMIESLVSQDIFVLSAATYCMCTIMQRTHYCRECMGTGWRLLTFGGRLRLRLRRRRKLQSCCTPLTAGLNEAVCFKFGYAIPRACLHRIKTDTATVQTKIYDSTCTTKSSVPSCKIMLRACIMHVSSPESCINS